MTTPAAQGYPSNASRTNAEMKQFLEDVLAISKELPGGNTTSTLTIASGSITPTTGVHLVDTEAAAATDDLTNIVQTNHPDGRLLVLMSVSSARNVVVKNAAGGTGQILTATGADFTLDDASSALILRRSGTNWVEVGRFYGNDKASFRNYLASPQASVASAATVDLTNTAEVVQITGTTPITAITLPDGYMRIVRFAGALTLTHNAATLILPGGANVTTAAGDCLIVVGESAGRRVVSYVRADGTPLVDEVGSQIGYARTTSTTTASTATTIPVDDTVPTATEGAEYSSLNTQYTAKFGTSILEIEVFLPVVGFSDSADDNGVFCIFQDSTCLVAAHHELGQDGTGGGHNVHMRAVITAGDTSAHTYSVRYGPQNDTAGTVYIGQSGGANNVFSTARIASMTVKEIKQ